MLALSMIRRVKQSNPPPGLPGGEPGKFTVCNLNRGDQRDVGTEANSQTIERGLWSKKLGFDRV